MRGERGKAVITAFWLPSVKVETSRIGGQNEIADWIHIGDGLLGAVYGGAMEGAESEGRKKVKQAVAGLRDGESIPRRGSSSTI